MMGAVRQVTGEELEKELSEWGTPIVLDVFAQVCGRPGSYSSCGAVLAM